jgi:predicted enzyme related to lactoylglutathione lyase
MAAAAKIGTVGWFDLTVPNADKVRDFYQAVVGWEASPVDMGGYNDFCMRPPDADQAVAGICHARGGNAGVPPQWLMYIVVDNVEAAAARCTESGGKVLVGPKEIGGYGRMCVIQDPAGAVAALYQPVEKNSV